MTAKEFLSRYRTLNEEINAKLDEAAQIRALAERVTPSENGGGSGAVSDRVGHGAARLVDLEREIDREIDRLVDMREEIETVIAKVKDVRLHLILTERYIIGSNYEKIAEKIGVSYMHTWRLHKKALSEVEKILRSENGNGG